MYQSECTPPLVAMYRSLGWWALGRWVARPWQGRIQDFWKGAGGGGGGSRVGLQAKKGGPDGGPILGPMLKSLHRGTKGGVRTPWTPPLDPLLRGKVYIESGCRLCWPSRQLHRRSARGSRSAGSGGRGSTHPPSGVLGGFFLVAWNPPPLPWQ